MTQIEMKMIVTIIVKLHSPQHPPLDYDLAGILVIGGYSTPSAVEFWSSTNADQESCQLSDYPREMKWGPTVNIVANNKLIACYYKSCDIYQDGAWEHLQDTIVKRTYHSAVELREKLLLIGGTNLNSTEFIPVDGSGASPGPFTVRHGFSHCTIKISEEVIVVTGGWHTYDLVTEYQLTDGRETTLTPLTEGRGIHACGVYQDADGQQVSGEVQTSLFPDYELYVLNFEKEPK